MTKIIYCIVEIDDDDGVYDGVGDELIIDDLFPVESLKIGVAIRSISKPLLCRQSQTKASNDLNDYEY